MAFLDSPSWQPRRVQHSKPYHFVLHAYTWPSLSQSISSSLVSTLKRIKHKPNSSLIVPILSPTAGALPHLSPIETTQNVAWHSQLIEKTSQIQTEVASVIGSAFQSSTLHSSLDLLKVISLSKFYPRKGFSSWNRIPNYQRTKTLYTAPMG